MSENHHNNQVQRIIKSGFPDFSDLPWGLPLTRWQGVCNKLEEVPRGLSRHPVVFVNYDGSLYSLKELPGNDGKNEYDILSRIEELHLPSVTPVGYALITSNQDKLTSVLITKYLDYSIPFRSLFIGARLKRYQEHLLNSIAGLLVQLHLADVFWGDCSLSNTLFRRDAGALRAYLVDAETAKIFPQGISPTHRHDDLQIMEENITGELGDLAAEGLFSSDVPYSVAGAHIRLSYQRLWEEITHEDIINPNEHYRIQERIRALNDLGFSVGNVELQNTTSGNQLRFRVQVTDRNFHHDLLLNLTGIEAEEMQARKMINEIQELRAVLSQQNNRSTPMSAAAYHWQKTIYEPTIERLRPYVKPDFDTAELYCQVLEHKWYMSEKAQRDVGHSVALEDYLQRIASK